MQEKGKRREVPTFVIVLIFFAGLSLMLYPTFSNWWNQQHQTRAIAGYVKKSNDLSAEERQKMWDQATAYNAELAKSQLGQEGLNFNLTDEENEEYQKILDVTGTGIMGYVAIPSIDVYLPIYHGTDEATLQIAIGHIAGTSLPVGGESSHCVISGHTGLPSARLFTDIDQLKKGDHFMLETLDETLTYEVDQIKVVLPTEIDDLQIEKGKELCTIVTCTPYGINTHRLLVRGHRVPNDKKDKKIAEEEALKIDYTPLLIGIVGLVIMIWCGTELRHRRKEKKAGNSKSRPEKKGRKK